MLENKNQSKEVKEALKRMDDNINRVRNEATLLKRELDDKVRELETLKKLRQMISDSLKQS